MTTNNRSNWLDYYQKIKGREPRPHLVEALKIITLNGETEMRAIDIGSGDGTETAFLLASGWHVLAVDGEPGSIEYLKEKVPPELLGRLQTRVSKFEDLVELPPAHLVHASYSLPFCPPEHFSRFWSEIVAGIQLDGYFSGQFFGPNDEWAVPGSSLTFHSRKEVLQLFEDFTILNLNEIDEDGEAASGPKHWHVFEVLAQRKR